MPSCLQVEACSTPFGITEFRGTGQVQDFPLSSASAQRLSASQSFAAVSRPVRAFPTECAQRLSASQSFAAVAVQHAGHCGHVLNAFRHHRVSRATFEPEPLRGSGGAQRLSASQSFAGTGAPDFQPSPCAVLNAFRHHRVSRLITARYKACTSLGCSTPFGITEFRGGLGLPEEIAACQMCSTPFGITEFRGSPSPLKVDRENGVLNAFRHHRVSRIPLVPDEWDRPCRAQRLSASQSFAAHRNSPFLRGSPRAQRLSASQSFAVRPSLPYSHSSTPRAQRLSASQSFAERTAVRDHNVP